MSKSKATIEPIRVLSRMEVAHGIYHIIAGHLAGAGQAFAYLGGRRIHSSTGETVEAAVASVIETLDLRTKALRGQREDNVPATAEFYEALRALDPRLVTTLSPLLRAHRYFPQEAVTFADIQRATGQAESMVVALYIKLGKAIGSILDIAPSMAGAGRRLSPVLVFATVEVDSKDRFMVRLRPPFIAAFDGILDASRRIVA